MKHLDRDLDRLRKHILEVGGLAESALQRAIQAYLGRDMITARDVSDGDSVNDEREVEVEEDCLKILALHQPVAGDLRYVVTCLKVNNDLERIGDLAANIAARTMSLGDRLEQPAPTGVPVMARLAEGMVRDSLRALVEQNPSLARSVLKEDEKLDDLHRQNLQRLVSLMGEKPDSVEWASQHLSVSRYLERVGDLATNIAEDVIFLVEGEVVRHRKSI